MIDFEDDDSSEQPKKSSEFAAMLEESFKTSQKKLKAGDRIKAEVLSLGKDDVFVSTGTMHDGTVPRRELLDAQGQLTCKVGDTLQLYVTYVRGSEIHLSPNKTAKNIADDLEDAFDKMLPVEGRVTEVCKGGVRVNIHGKTAFCPISQLDSKRIDTADEYVGKRFEFLITQFSEGGRNIVVSRRKLLDEQKELSAAAFQEERKIGDVVQGAVTRIEKFGAFVEIAPGVEGLVHISEISWSRLADAHEAVAVGQMVSAKVLKMEQVDGRLKISLSIKQAGAEPWDSLPAHVQEGAVVDGKVTRCMKFGAFVQLAPGVEGLIPLSEMSYTKRVVRSDELVKEGDTVSVMIKEIKPEERRISLSLKDAGSDPWAMVPQKFPVGRVLKGKVVRREAYGIFVQLEEGITGLLPKSKALEDPQFPFEKLRINDDVTVQVGELRPEERRISLQPPGDADAGEWKNFTAQTSSASFGTLGDQFKNFFDKKNKK